MKDDFITMYRKYHNLDDKWEKNMRKSVAEIQNNKNNAKDNILANNNEQKCYQPNTISKGLALFITIAVMIGSLIFRQWYIAWIGIVVWYFHTDRP